MLRVELIYPTAEEITEVGDDRRIKWLFSNLASMSLCLRFFWMYVMPLGFRSTGLYAVVEKVEAGMAVTEDVLVG